MKGYFEMIHERSQPIIGDGYDYMFAGFMVAFSPIGAPLYYLGRLAEEVCHGSDN